MNPSGKLTQPVAIRLYVLRLWRNGPSGPWHASLRPAAQGSEVHFFDMDALCTYLRSLAATAGGGQDSQEKPT